MLLVSSLKKENFWFRGFVEFSGSTEKKTSGMKWVKRQKIQQVPDLQKGFEQLLNKFENMSETEKVHN